MEAVNSLKSGMEEKEREIIRLKVLIVLSFKNEMKEYQGLVQREQKLILSAWYELGTQLQKKQNSHRASLASTWINQQRSQLDKPIKIRQV